ncbi:hypothetical protein VII00023_06207 [Vibrio ichthyoenteri ATCC 700023]|uniref:Uncharacterized protein n=2 Tax=Vibrio ichthyoenteri TaxID=142461 RepID=F9S1W0_9VIBR|nr:hypothetical protein VII00023_06207 [Vibrio ichthyoenteri ATCC 700023]
MESNIVLPIDEKIIAILNGYSEHFIFTGNTDDAQFYQSLRDKIIQGDGIDVDTLLFVAKVTSNKVLTSSALNEALTFSISNSEMMSDAREIAADFKNNATYLVGFIAVHLATFQ